MIPLPAGFHVRAGRRTDLAAVSALVHAVETTDLGEVVTSREELDSMWREPRMDPAEDVCVVHDGAGRMVGYALAWEGVAGEEVEIDTYADVLTRDTTLDQYLLEWSVARGGRIAGRLGVPLTAFAAAVEGEVREPLLVQLGFVATRWFHTMVIDIDAATAPEPVPGIDIKPLATAAAAPYVVALEAVHAATTDAFRDHWATAETSFEEWRSRRVDRAAFDPTLWFVALDDGEVVGALIASTDADRGDGRIPAVGVRRAWRKRGIAEALMRAAFAAFVDRGVRRVSLGVDAQSPTGATRLYERVGMTQTFTIVVYCRTVDAA